MKKLPLYIAALSVTSLVAFAADEKPAAPAKPKRDPAELFKNFDLNKDGGITLAEYESGMKGNMDPARIPAVFKQKDKDGDGKLVLEELMIIPPKPKPKAPEKPAAKPEKKP